jgi:S1-C subfamily serine protease
MIRLAPTLATCICLAAGVQAALMQNANRPKESTGAPQESSLRGHIGARPLGLADGGVKMYIVKGGPADLAGIKTGDVITAIDGSHVHSIEGLREAFIGKEVGHEVTITAFPDRKVTVKLVPDSAIIRSRFASAYAQIAPERRLNSLELAICGIRIVSASPPLREELDLPPDVSVVVRSVDSQSSAITPMDLSPGDGIVEVGDYRIGDVVDFVVAANGLLDESTSRTLSIQYRKRLENPALPYTTGSWTALVGDSCVADLRAVLSQMKANGSETHD